MVLSTAVPVAFSIASAAMPMATIWSPAILPVAAILASTSAAWPCVPIVRLTVADMVANWSADRPA
ncbi:hypothetical protein D3C86_2078030 [compost metagenome]